MQFSESTVMNKRAIFGWISAAAIALSVQAGPALASPVTINLDQVFTGATPDGPTPWLVATFEQTGSNTGTLTLTSHLTAPDFIQGLNSASSTVGWAFYLNQSLSAITCTTGACANGDSGFDAGGFNTGPANAGTFNLGFGWGPGSGNRFTAGESAVYNLTFASDLSGNPFVANGSGWISIAHVQGLGNRGRNSGWIVSDTLVSVPEPAELGLFGLGLLLVALFAAARRRWQ
jgi:hypothetical protein